MPPLVTQAGIPFRVMLEKLAELDLHEVERPCVTVLTTFAQVAILGRLCRGRPVTADIRPLVKVEDATSRGIVEVLVRLLLGVWSGAEYTDRDDVQARALRSAEPAQAAQRQARHGRLQPAGA